MSMDAQALPPAAEVTRWSFLIATIVLGCAGSLAGVAVAAEGTYAMGPFVVDLRLKPSMESTTNLAIAPRITGLNPGVASADTHAGFLEINATVVDLVRPPRPDLAVPRARSPLLLGTSLKEEGKAAARSFGIRAALGAAAGGAIGGGFMALFGFRPRRIVQGLIAGLVVVGVLGVIAWQTYDVNKFATTTFRPSGVPPAAAPLR